MQTYQQWESHQELLPVDGVAEGCNRLGRDGWEPWFAHLCMTEKRLQEASGPMNGNILRAQGPQPAFMVLFKRPAPSSSGLELSADAAPGSSQAICAA